MQPSILFRIIVLYFVFRLSSSQVKSIYKQDSLFKEAIDYFYSTKHFETISPKECGSVKLDKDLTKLKGHKFLIDSNEKYFPQFMNRDVDPEFPKVFIWKREDYTLESIAEAVRSLIDENLHLYGAMVIRGIGIQNGDEDLNGSCNNSTNKDTSTTSFSFSTLLRSLGYQLTKYVGGVTVRKEADGQPMIYPASEEDPEVCMDLHQDNVYWATPPAKLFFYYEKVAHKGGLNPLLDMRGYEKALTQLEDNIGVKIIDQFESKGVRYENFYPDGRNPNSRFLSWQKSFQTEDRQEVEKNLHSGNFQYEWAKEYHSNGTEYQHLRKWNVMSPFKTHPVTGERLWVNMIVANHASYFHDHPNYPELVGVPFSDQKEKKASQIGINLNNEYPFNVKYGDGSTIPYEIIQKLRGLAWEKSRGFKAQDGDLLIVDNYVAQHGRLGYKPPRKFWIGISLN